MRATALVSLFLLGACAQQPTQSVANPQFPVATPDGWSQYAPQAESLWPDQYWWQAFGSLELNELVQKAQQNNLDLGAASARVLQAEAQARVAGATLWPGLNLEGRASRQGELEMDGSRSAYGLGLGATYEIDFWGKNRAAVDAGQALLAASRFDLETVALSTTAATVNTFLTVLALRDRLYIARLNLETALRVLELSEVRVRLGAASPLELAQQRSIVAQQRASLPPLQQQERAALLTLATLLGVSPQDVQVATQSLSSLNLPGVTAGLPAELLNRRPDVRQAEAQLRAANANVEAARAALFPSIRLTGSAGWQGSSVASLFDGNPVYSLGSSLLAPIFDAGRLDAQKDLSEARQLELVQLYRRAVLAAFTDVENALVSLRSLQEQQQLQEQVVEQAQLTLKLAEIRYREGSQELLAVLDAQRTLYQAQDRYQQIQSDSFKARVDLFRALGGGWIADNEDVQ